MMNGIHFRYYFAITLILFFVQTSFLQAQEESLKIFDSYCGKRNSAYSPAETIKSVSQQNIPSQPSVIGHSGSAPVSGLISDSVGVSKAAGKPLAFPGAQGFGRFASGGRGGKVVFVTNTNDSGPGSLRHALENEHGPRTVIFRTGGIIELKKNIGVSDGNVTIAGQTAPGDGITLKNAGLKITSKNHIVRGLRIRPGDSPVGEKPPTRDGFALNKGAENVILDHNSVTWGVDENIQIWRGAKGVTVSNNLIAEGLNESIHLEGKHSKGLLVGPQTEQISVFRNLFADNHDRNVRFVGPQKDVEMTNNYIFNCMFCTRVLNARPVTGNASDRIEDMRILNNYYDTEWGNKALMAGTGMDGAYVEGNIARQSYKFKNFKTAPTGNTAIDPAVIIPADQLFGSLQNSVGANWPVRDSVDSRIIKEVASRATFGFAGIPDSPKEVGGYPNADRGTPQPDADNDGVPDEIEPKVGGNPNVYDSDERAEFCDSGYTRLELYINGIISGDFCQCD